MHNRVMSLNKFKKYMDNIKQDYDLTESLAKLNINIFDNMKSFNNAIDLLSFIFNDTAGLICFYIFETNFGQNTNAKFDNMHNITTIEELYSALVEAENNVLNKKLDY